MSKFYFRCTENAKAPATVVETDWEADEMRRHPFYEEVNESGDVLARPNGAVRLEIPFTGDPAPEPTKRATLKLPQKRVAR